jgi:hypothetical protein
MPEPSPVCRTLILDHADRLPREFLHRPGEPSYEGLQEVFWGCAAVLTRELLGDSGRDEAVRVGRAGAVLPVPPAAWDALAAELGLADPGVRAATAAALAAVLLDRGPPPAGPALGDAPPHLVGFLLVVAHLFATGRESPPPFAFDFRTLGAVARGHPLAGFLGRVDEHHAGRAFADYSGVRLRWETPLKIAHHAYYRRLNEWLGARDRDPRPDPPPLDPDFLLRGLQEREREREREKDAAPAAAPDTSALDAEIRRELNRLRSENDALRGVSVSAALAELLDPVLAEPGDARAAAEAAGPGSDLARRLVDAVVGFLRHPAVTPFGTPGEVVGGPVPSPEYQLDPSAPTGRATPAGYRVTRRGLRLNGPVVLPPLVIPNRDRRP